MSQADSFKSRIIDVDWSPVPSATNGSWRANGQGSAGGDGHGRAFVNGRGRHGTMPLDLALVAPPQPAPRQAPFEPPPPPPPPPEVMEAPPRPVITALALSSPVCIMEEVQAEALDDARLIVVREPGSVRARSFRVLQHRLFAAKDPRVLVVTSALPGEGKTTCAANLALVLAEQTSARVLLLDANLRRPGVGDVFGFEPADSLMTKLLRSEDVAAPYAVASVAGSRLHLAALRAETAAGKRLDRALLAALLRSLRDVYDYIVIDSASVLDSADAHTASQCADAVLVSARAGKSKRSQVRRVVDQLRPASLAGVVLLDT